MNTFPPEVTEELKSYVYLYSDPRDGRAFYVGKGVNNRVFNHLTELGESNKIARIAEIQADGFEPDIEILRHGLTDDQAALVEASIIDLLGLDLLTNQCRGVHSRSLGRVSAEDIALSYSAPALHTDLPIMLITINRLYRSKMNALELYEATRGIWKVGTKRERVRFACAVYHGVVREVYEIVRWEPAGTAAYVTREDEAFSISGRWEFVGKPADDAIRAKFVRHSVKHFIGNKSQNPIRYVNG